MMFFWVALGLLQASTYIHGSVTGTVTLKLKQVGHDLVGKIAVGKDKSKLLDVLFDTGADLAWVVSDEAKGKIELMDGLAVFDSSTVTGNKKDCKINYGGRRIYGYRITDTMTIKTEPTEISLQNYEFGVAKRISKEFQKEIFYTHSAVFGLNLVTADLMPGNFEPSITKLMDEISCFGFYIDRQHPEKTVLVFGEPSPNYIEGPLVPHDLVTDKGKYDGWNFKIDKFIVETSGSTGTKKEYPPGALVYGKIFSRSISLLVGPKPFIRQINDYIFSFDTFENLEKYDEVFSFPCGNHLQGSNLSKFPTFKIVTEGQELVFGPLDYIIRDGETNCLSALFGDDVPHFVIGNTFLAKIYTKFDAKNKKVHFAKAKKN